MMFEHFTDRVRRVFLLVQEQAHKRDHNSIDTEHILLGLIDKGENIPTKSPESSGSHRKLCLAT